MSRVAVVPPQAGWLVLPLLASTQFVLILDAAIVGVAMPSMAADLGFAAADLSWVANAYTLLFGGFLLLGGRVGDLIGRRRTFVLGVLVFSAASLAGGLAQEPVWLVAARAAQGLAAAFVAPSALSLLLVAFPEGRQRNRALGVWGAVAATGGAAGGLVGGTLTEWLGWASVMYVNVPIGLLVAWLAPRVLPAGEPQADGGGFDLAGALTVTAGLGLAIYALVDANDAGWASLQTLGLLALAAALLAAFMVIEARTARPLVPLRIFADRNFSVANLVAVLNTMAMFPTFFLLTLYLQRVLGITPLGAGLAFLAISGSLLLSTLNGPRLAQRFGSRPTMALAMAVTAAGLAWFGFISPDGSVLGDIIGPSIITGLGAGVAWTASAAAATSGANPQDAGLRSGVLIASQQVGGAGWGWSRPWRPASADRRTIRWPSPPGCRPGYGSQRPSPPSGQRSPCGWHRETRGRPSQRTFRKNSRTSLISRSGASMARKWPPRSSSDQRTMSWSCSAQRRIVTSWASGDPAAGTGR